MPVTLPETIVRRRCAALIPYARNARTHSDQQVAQIAASIREFGFTNPALIDEEDGIIAGHGRVLGAHLLGLDEVPVQTPRQQRQGIAVPQLGSRAEPFVERSADNPIMIDQPPRRTLQAGLWSLRRPPHSSRGLRPKRGSGAGRDSQCQIFERLP